MDSTVHASTPASMPITLANVTVGTPHCPGYGTRNQGESFIIFNLLSDLAGCPYGSASVTVNAVQIIHMTMMVSSTCGFQDFKDYGMRNSRSPMYTCREELEQLEPDHVKPLSLAVRHERHRYVHHYLRAQRQQYYRSAKSCNQSNQYTYMNKIIIIIYIFIYHICIYVPSRDTPMLRRGRRCVLKER